MESEIKTRLKGFFDKYPDKNHTTASLLKHFNDVKEHNLNYHLKTLVDQTFIVRVKQGVFVRNPDHQTPEQKREIVDKHIADGLGRVLQGPGWKPGQPSITASENPAMIAFLGVLFGESIMTRMESAGFTKTDIDFVKGLVQNRFPLTEQQRIVCSRAS
jgi:hypothetical protein